MRNILVVPFILLLLFSPSAVHASLVNVTSGGEVIVKVLSQEDSVELEIPRSDQLIVKDVVEVNSNPSAKLSLTREEGKVELSVTSDRGDKSLDVSGYSGEIIYIEERPQVNKISIGLEGDEFTITEKGITALTTYEINVDPENATLTLATPSGGRFLAILPKQAVDSLLRAKTITVISQSNVINLLERDGGLQYVVSGVKRLNLFNLLNFPIDVTAYVSASTGEIVEIEQPQWLPIVGYLLG